MKCVNINSVVLTPRNNEKCVNINSVVLTPKNNEKCVNINCGPHAPEQWSVWTLIVVLTPRNNEVYEH